MLPDIHPVTIEVGVIESILYGGGVQYVQQLGLFILMFGLYIPSQVFK